jgi:neocarzinostatin family protein/carboxypeptidase family protein
VRTLVRLVVALVLMCGATVVGTNAGAQTTRTLTVTPDSGLSDGDAVTLHGTGFTPSESVFYCEGVVDSSPDPGDCGTSAESIFADSSGEFTTSFNVQRFITPSSRAPVDCAQPDAACGIGAADFFSSGGAIVLTPITFIAQPPVELEITGTVTGPDGSPVAGAPVWAYAPSDGFVGSHRAVTASDGTYTITDLVTQTDYRVRFGPPTGSTLVPEWWNDAVSRSRGETVVLSFGAPSATLDAQLAEGGGIAGTVTDTGSAPLAGVKVYAYAPWDTWVGSYAATTGADGSYEIDGVWPSSDYRVRFVPASGSTFTPEWFDNQPTAATAARFEVTSGVIGTNVDASLAPASP